jgi:hypothetical protein
MKDTHNIKNLVKIKFANMQTKDDLLNLLNYVRSEVLGTDSHPFKMSQLTWAYNTNTSNSKYRDFSIKKKNGADRFIHAPIKSLKYIQKTLAFVLECVFDPHINAYGFIRGKSIVQNASRHANSRYVFNIDLKDFFPSVDQARVWKCFQLKPFKLTEIEESNSCILTQNSKIKPIKIEIKNTIENVIQMHFLKTEYVDYNFLKGFQNAFDIKGGLIKYNIVPDSEVKYSGNIFIIRAESTSDLIKQDKELSDDNLEVVLSIILSHQQDIVKVSKKKIANILAAICCTSMEVEKKNGEGYFEKITRNVLPQGAPTSPIVTNIVCQRLDYLLTGLANRFGLRYTRYADDITFSSNHHVYGTSGEFIKELKRIIEDQKFNIKESKTRLQKSAYRQEVTGLLVNKTVNVQKRYIKQIRTWIYLLENYEYAKAHEIILKHYLNDKGNVKKETVKIENVIKGKLQYLRMVRGENSSIYNSLNKRFSIYLQKNQPDELTQSGVYKSIRTSKDIPNNSVDYAEILDDIFEKGLDEALDKINL